MLIINYLIKTILFILLFITKSNANTSLKSKILFKIDNEVFTNLDLDKRINYIEKINNIKLNEQDNKEKFKIIEDYISSLIFYEYYKKNGINYKNINKEIENFYNKKITKKIKDKKNIKDNIKIDYIRKRIIEDILNSRKDIIDKKANINDLIYNYNINYIVIETDKIPPKTINNITKRSDFIIFKQMLTDKKIPFFFKEENIIDSTKLSTFIKSNLKINKKIFSITNDNFTTLVSLKKDLESYEGIFVKLVNFKTKNKIENQYLDCNNIIKQMSKTQFKEYEYSKLNTKVKNNLKSINDFILIKNQNIYNYIFLCEMRYNEDKLMTINFDKKINILIQDIQINFIKKYKKEFNFIKIDE